MRTRLTILAAGLALLLAAPADAAQRCGPRGSTTVAQSHLVRVYTGPERPRRVEPPSYACARRTGRAYKLDSPNGDVYLEGGDLRPTGPRPQLDGTAVAYMTIAFFGDQEVAALYRLDVGSGKRVRLDAWDLDVEHAGPFHLFARGIVGWSGRHVVPPGPTPTEGQVWIHRAGAKTLLGSGPNLDPESFAVSDDRRRLFWLDGDEAHTAPVR